MTGPAHYQEAERLLGVAEVCDVHDTEHVAALAQAAVHARLAQAAATVDMGRGDKVRAGSLWDEVLT